jgi:SWIM/SEC-C metal-binding protein
VARLGTDKRPAVVRVQSMEEAEEIVSFAQQRGWKVIVGVEPDQMEDLTDLRKLMRDEAKPEAKPRLPPKISGNDYCPCGSGRKFKQCCGPATASPGTMAPEFVELTVQIARFVDEYQPGIVECEFTDAAGRLHRLIDKAPIFTTATLTADSVYPQPGAVRCKLVRAWQDTNGRRLFTVSTADPFSIETGEGLTEFDVLPSQVSVISRP